MKSLSLTLRIFATMIFTLSLCTVAQAIPRTWVSAATGSEANPCTRELPCRFFNTAVNNTDPGGEVNVLDPGDYTSTVNISKSLTIDGGAGQVASMLVTFGVAFFVNTDPGETVVIRNLTINGGDTGGDGIRFIGSGGQLFLENVTIERFSGQAILVDSLLGPNPHLMEINNCRLKGNFIGIKIEDNSAVAVRNSVITGQLHKGSPPNSFGINMTPQAGAAASIKLENNEISYCQSALRAVGSDLGGGNPVLWMRGNHIFRNTYAANFTVNVQYFTDLSNKLSDNTNNVVGGTAFALPSM